MHNIDISTDKALMAIEWLDKTFGTHYEIQSNFPKKTIRFSFEDANIASHFALKWN